MTVSILPITEAHIEGFWAAIDVVARERRYLGFLEGPPLAMTRAFVRENLAGNWPHFVAVAADGQVIGWCDITALHRPVAAHVGILGLGVLPAWRGQGIGKQLMLAALAAAEARGLTRVELTVHAGNERAAALYRQLGFVAEGVRRSATLIDGVYGDSIMMAKLFGPALKMP